MVNETTPAVFWAVWRETGGSAPSKRHETKSAAIIEADRLAKQTNERYYVLEVIGCVEPMLTPVIWRDLL